MHSYDSFKDSARISLVPAIRFKGFTDAWEQRKLGEVVDVCSGKDYKHLSEGEIPVYGTGGYMLSVSEALSYDKDAIGIGRKGTIDSPYILKAPFWTVDTLFYAIPREKVNLNFAFEIFQNIDWQKKDESTGVPSLSKTAINKVDILFSQHDEQVKIGAHSMTLNRLITLHQRKVDKFKNVKKALLELLFPENGQVFPRVRFAGFTDAWEQRKLGELIQTIPFKSFVREPEYDGKFEIIQQGNEPIIGFANGTPCDDYDDTVIFGDHTLSLYKPTRPFFVATDGVRILKGRQSIDGFYLFSLLEKYRPKSEGYKRYYNIIAAKDCFYINNADGQKLIGQYFRHLDHLITLHQRKVEKLKNIKKALLEKMFV